MSVYKLYCELHLLYLTHVLDPAAYNCDFSVLPPDEKPEEKWITFDGPVDTLWIESMNSVMDDNKLLTLANGERIRLQKHCALLFEVKYSSVPIHSLTP